MRARWAAAVIAALVLVACGSEPEVDREPRSAAHAPAEVDTEGLRMPLILGDAVLHDPGWSSAPQEHDGVYLAPATGSGTLEFRAVDSDGEALWTAERPLSCTGFTVSTGPDGEPIAVLTDTGTTDDTFAGVTATTYDLVTGAEVWGPVDVPGPYQGPGLVFAAPPEGPMGDTGRRTALDPRTGDPSVTEGEDDVDRVIGEYGGIVLTVAGETLGGAEAATGEVLWEVPMAEHGWDPDRLVAAFDPSPGGDLALLAAPDGAGPLVDVTDGTVVADGVRDAVLDLATGAVVVVDAEGMRAVGADGQTMWAQSVDPEVDLVSAGGVLLYVRDGDSLRVHNVMTGQVAQGYDPAATGPIVVPELLRRTGDGIVVHDGRYLVASFGEVAPGSPGT